MYHLDAMVGGHQLRCRLTYSKITQIERFFAKEYPDLDNAWGVLLTAIFAGEVAYSGLVKILEICMVNRPQREEFSLEPWFENEPDLQAPFVLVVKMLEAALVPEKKGEAAADATTSKAPRSLRLGSWVGRRLNSLRQRWAILKLQLRGI